jgi:glycosyltransferase involved in cell wall biosynthesis
MKTKTIVHIITRLVNGGADENTVISCNYSASVGNKVYLLIGSENEKEIIHKLDKRVELIIVKNLVRPINPLKDMMALIKINSLLKRLSPDIVHTHTSKAGIIGRIAAWFNKIPLIVHTVHILPFLNVNLLIKILYILLEKVAAKTTHKFINVSAGMKEASLKYKIGIPSKHNIIYSAFNTHKFKDAKKSLNLNEFLFQEKISENVKIILMIGAFEKRKRHKELVHIFNNIVNNYPNTILLLVGEGKLMPEVRSQVKKLKLEKKVIFTGFRNDPEKIIALADICVLNSVREGLPRVVMQYIAGGKPAISTNLPGIEEIIKDDINGQVFDMHDPKVLYDKLSNLLSNNEKLLKLTNGAKETDVSNWSIESMGKKIEDLYNSFLQTK